MKTKFQDSLLDNKRLQDRFDSLEFYTKTNTNSSVFHNLIPSTYYPSGNKNGDANSNSTGSPSSSSSTGTDRGATLSLNTSRSRTPAPIAPRPRIPMSSSSTLSSATSSSASSNGLNYGMQNSTSGLNSSSYDRSSRQSSVERSPYSNFDNYSLGNTSYGSTHRLTDFSTRSRNASPIRTGFEPTTSSSSSTSASDWSSTIGRNSSSGRLAALPPHPTSFHYDSYSLRSKREPSTERYAQLRNRREASQDRAMRPSASSSYLTNRRSSFVDHVPSKYY